MRRGAPRLIFTRKDRTRLETSQLSGSERQAVLFAFSLADGSRRGGTLLIDEPELHVAGKDQVDYLGRLVRLAEGCQVIAATTSSAILAAARPEQVIDLARFK
jgi:ABC-type cobalamin/Fe3+-siderophores transport system ATPase subunit